jgi:myo-inositol-1(or 4)-monophosphatase
MSIDYKKVEEDLLNIIFEAGELLQEFQKKRRSLKLIDKGNDGLASIADQKSEALILSRLKEHYPAIDYLSEEDHHNKTKTFAEVKDKDYIWLIDPLDGTNNFINGIPIYAAVIGLLHKGEPVVGVVYNPSTGECFYASSGNGAHYIDFKLNPLKRNPILKGKNQKQMDQCVFSPAPQYEVKNQVTKFETQLSAFKKNIIGARAVRRLGSAALELCYVANGSLDGYWEKGLKPWDVCASHIICKEADVEITDFNGEEFNVFSSSILAAHKPLHSKIIGKIAP